jgi:hypothetical protein
MKNVRPVALGHAADHVYHHARVVRLALAELAEARPDLLFRVLTDGARVVDDDVGRVAVVPGRGLYLKMKLFLKRA